MSADLAIAVEAPIAFDNHEPIVYLLTPQSTTEIVRLPELCFWADETMRMVVVMARGGSIDVADFDGNTVASGLSQVGDFVDITNYGGVRIATRGQGDDLDPATHGVAEADKRVILDDDKNVVGLGLVDVASLVAGLGSVVTSTVVRAGSFSTGQGFLQAVPPSANKGSLLISTEDNAGDTETRLITKSQAGERDIEIVDSGSVKSTLAFGCVLDYLDNSIAFNGNTAGATTETTIMSGVLGADYARPGGKVDLEAIMNLASVNGADTLTLRLKRGSTTVVSAVLDSADVSQAVATMTEMIQSIGASGRVLRLADVTAIANSASQNSNGTADFTANSTYSLTAQWSSSNAANQATFMGGRIFYY